tara:strand:- start:2119 stop:2640 length:522 start_codon:yes stop_codon:yes gene_type:complete
MKLKQIYEDIQQSHDVFYHGTPYTFKSFDDVNFGVNTGHSREDVAYHFTTVKNVAITYSKLHVKENAYMFKSLTGNYPKDFKDFNPNLITVNLIFNNSYHVDKSKHINKNVIDKAKMGGYDSIIASNNDILGNEVVVFDTGQIKILNVEKLFDIKSLKSKIDTIKNSAKGYKK